MSDFFFTLENGALVVELDGKQNFISFTDAGQKCLAMIFEQNGYTGGMCSSTIDFPLEENVSLSTAEILDFMDYAIWKRIVKKCLTSKKQLGG